MHRRLAPLLLGAALFLTTVPVATAAPVTPAPIVIEADDATKPISWAAYLKHQRVFLGKLIANNDQLVDALEWYDYDTARKVLGSNKRLLAAEMRWLNAYRPAKCFKATYDRTKLAYASYSTAYIHLYRWMLAFPYGTNADYNRGMAATETGTTRLEQARILLDKTRC